LAAERGSAILRQILGFAAFAAAALTGTSCSPDAGSIFPMAIGSVWNTESCLLAGQATAALDTFETSVTMTTALEKVNLTNGKEVVKFRSESAVHLRAPDSTYTTTSYSLLREEAGAILSFGALDDTTGDTVIMVDPTVGQSWNQGSATAVVVGQEDVTVPAGTYRKAWKVKTVTNVGGITVVMFSWYARGVGNVKIRYEGEYQGYAQVYNQELTSATIK
jgi:hypothetical protein